MNIFTGILIGLGFSTVLTGVSNWVEEKYMECYAKELTNEIQRALQS